MTTVERRHAWPARATDVAQLPARPRPGARAVQPCSYADCPVTDKRPPMKDDEAYLYSNVWNAKRNMHAYCAHLARER
jgi:hypothetical protein